MNVIFIADKVEKYGATTSFKELVNRLHSRYGVNPIIISPNNGKISEFAKANNFEFHKINYESVFYYKGKNIIKNILRRNKLQKSIAENETRELSNLNKIIDIKKVDLIHSNINRNDFGCLISEKYGIPHIMHLREFADLDFQMYPAKKSYYKLINENTNQFIAISNTIKEHWIKKGIDNEKIDIIYNGVDSLKFKPMEKLNDGFIHIIMSGSIVPTKGQLELVKAISALPNDKKDKIKVDLYGDGNESYINKIKYVIKRNDLKNIITFKGYTQELYKNIGKYDIGITCSRSEAFGRVTAEYMISGVIPIVSNKGANQELIDNNVNGFVYEYGDYIDLSNKIEKAINLTNEQKCKLITNAEQKAKSKFTADLNAKQIYEEYKKILKLK